MGVNCHGSIHVSWYPCENHRIWLNLAFSRRTDCLSSLIFVKYSVRMQTLTSVCLASRLLRGKTAANPGSTWQEGKQRFSVLDSSLAGWLSMPEVRPSALATGLVVIAMAAGDLALCLASPMAACLWPRSCWWRSYNPAYLLPLVFVAVLLFSSAVLWCLCVRLKKCCLWAL